MGKKPVRLRILFYFLFYSSDSFKAISNVSFNHLSILHSLEFHKGIKIFDLEEDPLQSRILRWNKIIVYFCNFIEIEYLQVLDFSLFPRN